MQTVHKLHTKFTHKMHASTVARGRGGFYRFASFDFVWEQNRTT